LLICTVWSEKGLRAGVESYSIKKLEPFYGLNREVDLHEVSRRLRAVEYAIARGDAKSIASDIRDAVLSYNRDDCFSALRLRDWLEALRTQAEKKQGKPIPRPTSPMPTPKEELGARLAQIRALSEALTAPLPVERNKNEGAPNDAVLARLRRTVANSTGAACSSGTQEPSHVLRAMGLSPELQDGALRISTGKFNTLEEIDFAASEIASAITEVRAAIGKSV
jgi:hypothetical protein